VAVSYCGFVSRLREHGGLKTDTGWILPDKLEQYGSALYEEKRDLYDYLFEWAAGKVLGARCVG
jgi:hypothetical protein